VFGFAVCFAMPSAIRFGTISLIGAPLSHWFFVLAGTLLIMQGMVFATSAVVVMRAARFHRQPRSSEWLALLICVWFLSLILPPPDAFITRIWGWTGGDGNFTVWRWITGGVALVVSVVVLMFAVRTTHAGAVRTLMACLSALILMWGPCAILKLEFTDLFPWLERLGDGWTFWFVLNALRFVANLPLAMLFGFPLVATILARRRDRFHSLVWTEWLGMLCVTIIGTTLLMFTLMSDSDWQSTRWMAERIVSVLGLACVAVVCCKMYSRCQD